MHWKRIVGGLGCIIIPLLFLAHSVTGYYHAQAVEDTFEPINATIQSLNIDDLDRQHTDNEESPHIYATYEYNIDGETYTSDNIHASTLATGGNKGVTESTARSFREQHSSGDTVVAYYNPDNPSEAFLLQDSYGVMTFLLWILCLFFIYIGVKVLLGYYRIR